MIKRIRLAMGFLTVLPVNPRKIEPEDLGAAVKYFPIVGLLFAGLVWAVLRLITPLGGKTLAGWLAAFAGAALNGWIHWDGWADTADGMGSRDPQKSLVIMKGSRIGAFGTIALSFLILGKVITLSRLTTVPLGILIGVMTISRWAMVVLLATQPPVSQGLASTFRIERGRRDLIFASLWMLAVIVISDWRNIFLLGISLVLIPWVIRLSRKRFGGITGDLLGATNEMVELTCLIVLSLRFPWWNW